MGADCHLVMREHNKVLQHRRIVIPRKYGITGPTYWPLVGNFYHEMKSGLSKYHKAKYLEYKAKGDKVNFFVKDS